MRTGLAYLILSLSFMVLGWLCVSAIVIAEDPAKLGASEHWAHHALRPGTVPDVPSDHWSRGPIDRYVLDSLGRRGLEPVGDASADQLLRRLAFQLTGLPPDERIAQDFVENHSDAATEQLVDRLLASPRFGERFGRHWLDLARYADSNGLDENFLFREAWRYRNWVRDALNDDMTFDRFLLEQIAGDLLPHSSTDQRDRQRIAAGFLVIGPKVLLGNNPENQRMEVADELLDTLGKVVLGQTLGCARCHDHKFDPVPTAEYYALAGIFASTQVMQQRFMLGEQRVMERLVGLGDDGEKRNAEYEAFYRELPALRERAKKAGEVFALLRQGREELLSQGEREQFSDALAAEALDDNLPPLDRIAGQGSYVQELKQRMASPPPIPPRAMIPADVDKPADEHVRIAGKFDDKGAKVPRGFLRVLCTAQPVPVPESESGRVALSHWLVDTQQLSGQLAARVLANRIWHHLIGLGLVRTVDNFGTTGEPPSHPELLDYLASRLIESGWSIKALVREIVLSRTFALSTEVNAQAHEVDPENQFLWRAHRRRLDPESFRDAMLAAAGQLDLSPMNSTVWYLGDQATAVGSNPVRRRTDFPCRSFYLPVIRNDLPELFEAMDFTNPHMATGARPSTTAPSQAWFVLNDAMVMKAAEQLAERILREHPDDPPQQRVAAMFRMTTGPLSRRALAPGFLSRGALAPGSAPENSSNDSQSCKTDSTHQTMLDYIQNMTDQLKSQQVDQPERRAWSLACHALLASSRFQYID